MYPIQMIHRKMRYQIPRDGYTIKKYGPEKLYGHGVILLAEHYRTFLIYIKNIIKFRKSVQMFHIPACNVK